MRDIYNRRNSIQWIQQEDIEKFWMYLIIMKVC